VKAMQDQRTMYKTMVDAGLENYLDWSMSADIIAAPVAQMEGHFPDAALFADQAPPPKSRNIAIIATATLGALLLVSVVIVSVCRIRDKKAQAEAAKVKAEAKLQASPAVATVEEAAVPGNAA